VEFNALYLSGTFTDYFNMVYLQVLAIEFIAFVIQFITLAIEFLILAIEFVTLARKFVCNKIGNCSKHENKM